MRGKLLKKLAFYARRIPQSVCGGMGMIAGTLIFVMVIITAYEVVMRHFFNRPSIWVLEYSIFMLLFIVYLGASYTEYQRGHIRVDIVYNLVNKKVGAILELITSCLALVYGIILTWACWHQFQTVFARQYVSATLLRTPLSPIQMTITIGAGLLCLAILAHIVQNISALCGKDSLAGNSQKAIG